MRDFLTSCKASALAFWLVLTTSVIVLLQRGPYFLVDRYEALATSQDARWWWAMQQWFYRGGEGFNKAIMEERVAFRLPTDVMWQKLAVWLSGQTGVELFTLNLFLSSGVVFLCFAFCFLFGWRILKSPIWAAAFTFLVSISVYAGFLRYSIIVPKMFGFMFFPLAAFFLYGYVTRRKLVELVAALVVMLAGMTCYFVSFAYTAPSLAMATTLAVWFLSRAQSADTSRMVRMTGGMVAFWGVMFFVSLAVAFALKGGDFLRAPALELTEVSYQNHQISFKKITSFLIMHASTVLALGWFFYAYKHPHKWRAETVFLLILSGGLFVGALIAQIGASYVDFFRTTWYWRSGYYGFLPSTLLFVLMLRDAWTDRQTIVPSTGLRDRLRQNKVFLVMLAAFVVASVTAKYHNFSINWRYTLGMSYVDFWDDARKQNMNNLIAFSWRLPEGTRLVLPPQMQGMDTDLLEAEGGAPLELSRNDSIHGIYQTDMTETYSRQYGEYGALLEAWKEERGDASRDAIAAYVRNIGGTHFLLPRKIGFEAPMPRGVREVFGGDNVVIYCLEGAGDCSVSEDGAQ